MKAFSFPSFNHVPGCRVWIDSVFPSRFALNYAHAGRICWQASPEAEPLVLEAPVAWWTWPGPRFLYGWREQPGWDHYYVAFEGAAAELMAADGWIDRTRETAWQTVAEPETFRDRMLAMMRHIERREERRAWVILLDLLEGLRESRRTAAVADPRRQRLRELAARIQHSPERPWPEEETAREFGLSASQFRRLFRAEVGLPFRRYCLRERMTRAAALLRRSELSVKEIAEACGVEDIHHFTQTFHRHHGVPPARYRRRAWLLAP